MKQHTLARWGILVVAMGLLAAGLAWAGVTRAQTGGPYDLTWSTIDGGGYTFSTGGNYSLGGTVGQPDASATFLSGGSYTLAGGFWGGPETAAQYYYLYLPLVLRQYP